MLGGIFKPSIKKDKIYQYIIGKQHLLIIEISNKSSIINNKIIEDLFIKYENLYFFSSFFEMEQELDILITNTNENFVVILY